VNYRSSRMPTVEGLELRYALEVLPPGRLPFRRWRWELWHGPRMIAAGWRVSERDAGRALCSHASAFAHRFFGLPAPKRADAGGADLRPGTARRLVLGPITCLLVPRGLEETWTPAT
jgi:hypothetical protein